ncbi:site-specific integrase [Halorubrum sp. AD140]|uniref:tyrosine-type recombinase/integrase n=1 Tax=Halorubrum sp. AD140 TaxID=3050073 RepID=UPI002ACCFD45|nr:site-specific integrase [Halorubrum sp. AD140]MDZ5810268.1 site-specific integrase [Halorubrum sp. AD140]
MEIDGVLLELERSRGRRYAKHAEDFRAWLTEHDTYDVDVFEASEGHIRAYLRQLRDNGAYLQDGDRGYAPTTIHLALVALSKFYQTASDFGGGVENPTEDVTVTDLDGIRKVQSRKSKAIRGKHVILDDEEIRDLCENVPAPALRNELIIKLMLQTACRRGEIRHIRLQDIDRDTRKIRIYGEKTDDYRTVRYQNSLKPLMSQWIDVDRGAYAVAEKSDYLFPSRQTEQISSDRLNYIVTQAAKNADIQEVIDHNAAGQPMHRITCHALRSTALTRLLNEGMSTRHLQQYAGHSQVSQTEEYLNPTDEEVLDAVDQSQAAFDFEE